MTAIASTLTGIAKRMGVARPNKRWIQANVETGFHSLSPDLLVAVVRAFEGQTDFEGRAFYEFGVFRGYSLWFAEQISRGRTPTTFQFHGFDSFEGLPETRVDARFFGRGDLTAGYNRVRDNLTRFGADWSRIQLHKGFYSDPFFSELSSRVTFDPVSIAVIDVVVYESCVPVLNFLGPRLVPGSILVFDDFNDMGRSDQHGERRAFKEYTDRTGLECEQIFELGFECVAFRVKTPPRLASPA
jgi:O-methyltransferase